MFVSVSARRWGALAGIVGLATLAAHGLHVLAALPAAAVWIYTVADLPYSVAAAVAPLLKWAGVGAAAGAAYLWLRQRRSGAGSLRRRVVVFRVTGR